MLTYFFKIGQKGFNRQILYQFDRRIQSRDSATRAIQRLARVSDPYPLPLEKPSSLTLSRGLGFGFRHMILAYSLDHFVTFQGISLDFLYLLRGRRR